MAPPFRSRSFITLNNSWSNLARSAFDNFDFDAEIGSLLIEPDANLAALGDVGSEQGGIVVGGCEAA